MENSYSKSVNQVLKIAREQAQNFHHRLIGTEHVIQVMALPLRQATWKCHHV